MNKNQNKIQDLANKGFITKRDEFLYLLNYEIISSWWAGYAFLGFLQNFASAYYLRKVKKKYKRFAKMNPYTI